MPSPAAFDPLALVHDALAVVRAASAASVGWRTICVRAQRTIGRGLVLPLMDLDLDGELPSLARAVRDATSRAPLEIDTLIFGMFDGDDDASGPFTGFHLAGMRDFDASLRWLDEPTWVPERATLVSPSLDVLARTAAGLRGTQRLAVTHLLRFGAAALLGRFAARGLPYRVVVAFDGGDCAEVTEHRPAPSLAPPPPLLTRI